MAGSVSFETPEPNEALASSDSKIRAAIIALREAINGGLSNENLSGAAGITRANLAKESKPVTWYSPKVISTEEVRSNTSYGTLGTEDAIPGVVLPEGGIIKVFYRAHVKQSVSEAGIIGLFLGANQVATANGGSTIQTGLASGTGFGTVFTSASNSVNGLQFEGISNAESTTGQSVGYGALEVFAPAGTYTVSVRYKASSGSITAKERKLWVEVHGF
jgi:hypothetical protein